MSGKSIRCFSLSIFLVAMFAALPVRAQVAVKIDRETLGLVGAGTGCPADSVIFVTAGNQVRPVCNRPEPEKLEASAKPANAVPAAPMPPPAPTWVALGNAPVQATLRTWLPKDWRLAWDTPADPRGVPVRASGDFLTAVKALFATRGEWSGGALEARAFPKEKILQVRNAPGPAMTPTVTAQQAAPSPDKGS